jgi:DNA transposition AAA+ family ATPase
MEINEQFKTRVTDAIRTHKNYFEGSDAKHAVSLGLSSAQYSRIMAGELDRVLSDAKWITLSRLMEQKSGKNENWVAAETPVFVYIQNTFKKCQKNALSTLICDLADIGKTFAARHYAAHNKNAIYIDCSQVKSKQKLVRKIAKEFGVTCTGKYAEVYDDLVYYLNYINNPMVILDEAGDMSYEAFLELKALWNATERHCGWAMIGADGLKEKIRRAKDCKKVGYAEMFSRYGSRYQRITPEGKDEAQKFTTLQAALIIKANAPKGTDVQQMLRKTDGSLRRINNEVSKLA